MRQVSPPSPSIVPCVESDACRQVNRPNSLAFEAIYFDRDVDQTLYAAPYINGVGLSGAEAVVEIPPSLQEGPEHQSPVICIPIAMLKQPCNRVRLVVTDNLADQRRPVGELLNQPNVDFVEWYLSPSACDTESGAGQPYTSLLDCLPPDGGL
ncbi:MAG TPA: hypothetical protein VFX59_11825 [Polyangiales bacterium]|nr:hypothetical protein [Polyangiales bacterium]